MAQQRNKKRSGDATGRKTEKLKQQHAEELAERAKEIGLINAERDRELRDEVVDLTASQQHLVAGTRHPHVNTDALEVDASGVMTVEGRESGVQTNDTEVVGFGPETPFDVPGSTPEMEVTRRTVDTDNAAVKQAVNDAASEDGEPTRRPVTVAKADDAVEFRVGEDVEDMTFGVGNTFTLEAGRRYKGPQALVDHLEEKGLIYH